MYQSNSYLSFVASRRMSIWSKLFLIISFVILFITFVSALASIFTMLAIPATNIYYSHYFLHSLNVTQCFVLLILVIEALFTENEYHLITFILSVLIMTARILYAAIQILVLMSRRQQTSIIVTEIFIMVLPAAFIILCQIALVLLMIPVFRSFGWKLYRFIGASPHLIRHYRTYVSLCFCHLVCYCRFGCCMQSAQSIYTCCILCVCMI